MFGRLFANGKTAAVRVLGCAAALDLAAELWVHELKGTDDLDALECLAHRPSACRDLACYRASVPGIQLGVPGRVRRRRRVRAGVNQSSQEWLAEAARYFRWKYVDVV